jgi:hypothetical protein
MTKRGPKFKATTPAAGVFLPAPGWYGAGMRFVAATSLFSLLSLACMAVVAPPAAAEDAAATLCRSNPAYGVDVMRGVLEAQLEKDHDPALDEQPPAQMAVEASEQGIKECGADLAAHPAIFQALVMLRGTDLEVGWDAYNTACADRAASKADCIKAEVGSVRALKKMMATNTPPGSKALVETCELVLQSEPAMADWRECVDLALAAHAAPERAVTCKTNVPWHVAKTGAQAGKILAACLSRPG